MILHRSVCEYLSLCCDPDGQAAVVPVIVHKLSLVVLLLLLGADVKPHVMDHTVVLNITPW